MDLKGIQIFDCTLREAGFQTGWFFDPEFVTEYYQFLNDSGIDYMEIGFMTGLSYDGNKGIYRYSDPLKINSIFASIKAKTKLATMRDIQRPFYPLSPRSESVIDAVRILTRADETDLTVLASHVQEIRSKGYEVFVNFTNAGEQSYQFHAKFFDFAKQEGIGCIYFADTNSTMTPELVSALIEGGHAAGLKIGMHFHNRSGQADALLEAAVKAGVDSLDFTLLGLGGKYYDGNAMLEFCLFHRSTPLSATYNRLKRGLIENIIKHHAHSAAVSK